MKKIILLLTASLFLLTSCISYTELNDIGIVNMIGITKINENYEITINMIIPNDKDIKENKIFKVKNKNLDEGFNNLYEKTLRKIYLSHVDLLLISDNLKKEDYDNIINLFFNRNDSRNTFSTVIIKDYNSNKIFKTLPENINSLLNVNSKENGIVKVKQFNDIVKDILELKFSLIPQIKIDKEINILGYKEVYSNNKSLSKEESLAYNFITNNIESTYLLSSDKSINYKVNSSITRLKTNKNNIEIIINSNITVLSNNSNINSNSELKEIYIKNLTNLIDNYVNNNDLTYFYNQIKKYDYNYYKENKYKKINFKYNINTSINENSNTYGGNTYE